MKKILACSLFASAVVAGLSCGLGEVYWCVNCGPYDDYGSVDTMGSYASTAFDSGATTTLLAAAAVVNDPVKVAGQAAANMRKDCIPEDCFNSTFDGKGAVDVEFKGCTCKKIPGTITGKGRIGVTAGQNGPSFTLTGDFVINGTVHAMNTSGEIRPSGQISMKLGGRLKGVKQAAEHQWVGEYSHIYDSASDCRDVAANWTGTTTDGKKVWTTTVAMKRCGGGCPATGGTIVRTEGTPGAASDTVTLTFDGSAKAKFQRGNESGTFDMECTPAN